MLKHPNSNGMQLDIDTGGYIPARFVKEMTVKRGNDLVFHMESTFSISTNPNFRFTFGRGGDNDSTSPWSTPTARCLRRSRSQAGPNFPTSHSWHNGLTFAAIPPSSIGGRPPSRPFQVRDAKKPLEPSGSPGEDSMIGEGGVEKSSASARPPWPGSPFFCSTTFITKPGAPFIEATVRYFSFFTILTNILVALALTLPWLAPDSSPC